MWGANTWTDSMLKKFKWVILLMVLICLSFFYFTHKTEPNSQIKVAGKMSEVMWHGLLEKRIDTDTLNSPKTYGIGPMAYLEGEVLVMEGQTYISKVLDSSTIAATEVSGTGAPFFVYITDSDLKEVSLPLADYDLDSIEAYLNKAYAKYDHPLLVRIDGDFDSLIIHAVNLPKGKTVSNPEQAHEGLTKIQYPKTQGSLIGFFSRKHQSIFTHHDSFFHAHFISEDKSIMGHVDALDFRASQVGLSVSK